MKYYCFFYSISFLISFALKAQSEDSPFKIKGLPELIIKGIKIKNSYYVNNGKQLFLSQEFYPDGKLFIKNDYSNKFRAQWFYNESGQIKEELCTEYNSVDTAIVRSNSISKWYYNQWNKFEKAETKSFVFNDKDTIIENYKTEFIYNIKGDILSWKGY